MTKPEAESLITVAMVDDDQMYREYVGLLLSKQKNITFFSAADGEGLFEILKERKIDCILLDYNLGRETGLSIHAMLEERYADPPPAVMLTGDGRERTVIKAMRLGIRDYVPKRELKVEELVSVITRTVKRHHEEQEHRAEHRRLVQVSGVDTVTGLLAREPMEARLARLDALPPRARGTYGLLLVEMSDLDSVIARFGLGFGDRVLRTFAQRLRIPTRPIDVCGRYEGSTFLYIVDAKADAGLIESLVQQLLDQTDFRADFDEGSLHLTSRIGAALYFKDGHTTAEVVAAAQRRLEEAKATGRRTIPRAQSGEAREIPVSDPADGSTSVDESGTRSTDKRRAPRQRVFKRGQVLILGTGSTFDCTLRNISQTGAGLRFDAFFALPEEFDLMIVGSGQRRRVRVRWQSGVDVGVEYLT